MSIFVRKKVPTASSGLSTIGSPLSLNEVLSTIGTPERDSKELRTLYIRGLSSKATA